MTLARKSGRMGKGQSQKAIELEVPVFGEREGECGNTALKAVSWYQGQRLSARRLGKLAHLTKDGIDHAHLVRGARRAGARTYGRNGTLAQLRAALERGVPPIVGWWSQDPGDPDFDPKWPLIARKYLDCGHYSVVCGMGKRGILLMDPQWETKDCRLRVVGHRWMSRPHFLRVWYDTDTPRYRKVKRWFMVAEFP
jgi:ABC-type bacteriocin/lantibiotic exporter with double-glycine peptidase domain